MKLLLITVNRGNPSPTIAFIDSLLRLDNFDNMQIVIADNASDDEDYYLLKIFVDGINKPNISLHRNSENIGYFKAFNRLLKNFSNIDLYDAVIISNNDIIIKDSIFFKKIIASIEKGDVIAPRIISLVSGKDQNPHREHKVSAKQKFMYKLLFINFFCGKILYFLRQFFVKSLQAKPNKNLSPHEIFSAHGAFIIFTKKYFQKGGYIDDDFFLFGEEDSVAAICYQKKIKIYFCPDIIVYHDEHKNTKAFGFRRNIYKMQRETYFYIKNKYENIIY